MQSNVLGTQRSGLENWSKNLKFSSNFTCSTEIIHHIIKQKLIIAYNYKLYFYILANIVILFILHRFSMLILVYIFHIQLPHFNTFIFRMHDYFEKY